MLIRSQDKKEIHNINRIAMLRVVPNITEDKKYIVEANSQKTVGVYSTEEKAIKVLDMIQDEFCDCGENGVFNMPTDEEVEV